MNKELIARFANFLETKVTDEEFNFENLISKMDEHNCGTVCCAAGWLPRFDPENWRWGHYLVEHRSFSSHVGEALRDYFDMPPLTVRGIFYNRCDERDIFYNRCDENTDHFYGKGGHLVTRSDVIEKLRALIIE